MLIGHVNLTNCNSSVYLKEHFNLVTITFLIECIFFIYELTCLKKNQYIICTILPGKCANIKSNAQCIFKSLSSCRPAYTNQSFHLFIVYPLPSVHTAAYFSNLRSHLNIDSFYTNRRRRAALLSGPQRENTGPGEKYTNIHILR